MQNPSDEIKSKLDIVDVIREYIPLKPAGVNFRALCPFHREKTPSFIVSPEKQIWHCFGCSKGGDIFSFIMEMEGIGFAEALRNLAPKAGVTLRRQDPKLVSQRNRLLDIVEFAKDYYHKTLFQSKEAGSVRKYLAQRGLNEETIEEWQIGYSPDSWDDLVNLLDKKGYKENEIFLAGMSAKKEGTSRFYNRFRGRIMFPINDINGNTVAFSARVTLENEEIEKMGKYINSPQTIIYDKSRILFGLDKAKQEIKRKDLVIIVEGQMDVITAHQHGYKNVVASSGTSLTSEQAAVLRRYSNNIALAFDMDKAGEMAAERGIKELMQAEMNTKIIEIPKGKDPDECIKSSRPEWEGAVKKAKPIMEYYFDKTFADLDLGQVESRRKAVKELLPVLAKLGNKIEQDFWLKKLGQVIDVGEDILRETLDKIGQRTPTSASDDKYQEAPAMRSREEMLSEILLALILKFPTLIEYTINHVQPDQIAGLGNSNLYRNLIIYYNNLIDNWTQGGTGQVVLPNGIPQYGEPPQTPLDTTGQVSYEGFKSWLESLPDTDKGHDDDTDTEFQGNINDQPLKISRQIGLLDRLALLGDKDFYNYTAEQAKSEVIKITVSLKKYYLTNRRKEIKKLIAQAEKEGNEEHIKGLMEEFKALTDEIQEVGE
jgi:DNA primase